jgi:hypothetical protein
MKKRQQEAEAHKGSDAPQNGLAQHEIVALAAYLAGADRGNVDTEDIAVKANEIAPGRFSWRKFKDQIDLDLIYKHLWDLTKEEKGSLVSGSKKGGWLLTPAGTTFSERAVSRLEGLQQARVKRPRNEEVWFKRERNRMFTEPAFQKVQEGRDGEISKFEAEKFFRLDEYIVGAARERKIQQARNAFQNDPDLGAAVTKVASILRGTA